MIAIGSLLDGEMSRTLIETAKEKEIPYQFEAIGGGTGTNADNILIARGGVKTGILSLPQGYMHTPVEKIKVEDIENCARLMAEYVKKEGNR